MPQYTETPVGRFPLSKGMGCTHFDMNAHQSPRDDDRYGSLWKRAFENPGVTQRAYHEEVSNNYEYESRATWDPKKKHMIANDRLCPYQHGHHVGSICGCCGMRD